MLADQPGLDELWQHYLAAIDINQHEQAVEEAIAMVMRRLGVSPDEMPPMVVIPNPLQAPEATDVVKLGGETYILKAKPDTASCVHEILHHLFGPQIAANRATVNKYSYLLTPVYPDMLKLCYAWDDGEESWQRVFEEHLIRALEIWVSHDDGDRKAAFQAGCGFKYVPAILEFFQTKWAGLQCFDSFLAACLEELTA